MRCDLLYCKLHAWQVRVGNHSIYIYSGEAISTASLTTSEGKMTLFLYFL